MVELVDIIPPDNVILNLPSCSSKRQVLRELAVRGAAAAGIDQQVLLDALTERERCIVRARMMADEPETLDRLGARLGVSRERVRQLETRARQKMHDALVA
jgi:RNA polymerase sigma-32 factor